MQKLINIFYQERYEAIYQSSWLLFSLKKVIIIDGACC